MAERRACRLASQPRGTQRYRAQPREDEDALTQAVIAAASQYGRYGYRRITAVLRDDGWQVGKDRVERIWRREGLKVPKRQKPRGRLWFKERFMARRKKHTVEQVVNLLRQIEVAVANGKTTALACKEAEITEQSYYRWRKEYGGLQVDQAKRLRELEQENQKLKRLVANLSLDNLVLKDFASGNF